MSNSLTKKYNINLTRRFLIYIPTYNVEARVVPLIDEIPKEMWDIADILVLDNCSSDKSFQNVLDANANNRWPRQVLAIKSDVNVGYSGSQKLAYKLALENPNFESILMLHGDGQYSPELIPGILKYLNSPHQVVYGYRSWWHHRKRDETPISSYITIKLLSLLESVMTGIFRREWHSGFVMYKRKFLTAVNFDNITTTMHIDGHLQFAAGKLKMPVKGIPIFKRYKNYPALGFVDRIGYVFDVLRLIPKLHFISIENPEQAAASLNIKPIAQL
jgi:glycosyltransferase involved in cell wall biosynthesis